MIAGNTFLWLDVGTYTRYKDGMCFSGLVFRKPHAINTESYHKTVDNAVQLYPHVSLH